MYEAYKMLNEKLVTTSPETYKTGPVTEDRPEHCSYANAQLALYRRSACWRHPLKTG
jgi:hypothetical protein